MSIWFNKKPALEEIEALFPKTMAHHLGMKWEEIGDDFLRLSMPVTDLNRQPYGLLHGGASCAMAETIGSVASFLVIDHENFRCVGMEINANHIRSVREGTVYAIAKPFHLGRTSHVWDIRIADAQNRLICVSRLTVAILTK